MYTNVQVCRLSVLGSSYVFAYDQDIDAAPQRKCCYGANASVCLLQIALN